MTLPIELETSVTQLRAKHAALIDAVNAYRSGTIDASKQELLEMADDIDKQLTVEEYTLLGQVARKGRMPSLLLDFANGKYAVGDRRLERFTSLADILTFSRSTGGGRFNAQGQYEWVPANTPRIDYDPVTGECKGLLIEEQRTNLYSQNALLGSLGGSGSTYTLIDGPNPEFGKFIRVDGVGSAVTPDVRITVQEGQSYTLSVYSDKPTPISVYLWSGGVGAYTDTVVTPVGGGLYRHTRPSAKVPEGVTSLRPHFSEMSGHTFGWVQVEEGTFPTSYIITEGSSVTRAGDVPRRVVGSEHSSNAWTIAVRGVRLPTLNSTGNRFLRAYRGSDTRFTFNLWQSSSNRVEFSSGVGGARSTNTISVGQRIDVAVTIDIAGRTQAIAVNGEVARAAISDLDLSLEQGDILEIGSRSAAGQFINSPIQTIELYPFALSDAELQEITAQ